MECDQSALCPVREPLRKVHEGILRLLSGITISDLSQDETAASRCMVSSIQTFSADPDLGRLETDTMKLPIYMDNHATTPVDPRVFEAMTPYFTNVFGNSASRNHSFGWEAEEAAEKARKQVAELIGATAKEIVFTSGATESNNLALKGVAEMYAEKGNHIITAATEHKAILDTCKRLEKDGMRVTYLPVQQNGLVDLDQLRERDHGQDHPDQHHVRQQRNRRAAADSPRSARSPRNAACCSIPTRRRRSARFRWT